MPLKIFTERYFSLCYSRRIDISPYIKEVCVQVAKIREAIEVSKLFTKRAEEILAQSGSTTNFLLCNGKFAKILKQTSNKVMQAMQEMRRP
jgi:hypothetical protein